MAFYKALFVLALVAVVSSSPLFGPMEHHLFGIPLPHTNNPIAHNLENMLTHGLEDITGIHSVGNDKHMDMGGMPGMDMGGSTGMAGMDMGGSSGSGMSGMPGMDMGGSSGMAGMDMGGSSGSSMSGMSGMKMGGSSRVGGLLGSLFGGMGSSSKPVSTPVSPNSDVNQKQLLQYLQLLQAQAQAEKQKTASSSPSSDEILKYLLANSKPAVTENTLDVKNVSGENADDLQQKIAALMAAQGQR